MIISFKILQDTAKQSDDGTKLTQKTTFPIISLIKIKITNPCPCWAVRYHDSN